MPKKLPPIPESHEELLTLFHSLADRERHNRLHALLLVKTEHVNTRQVIADSVQVNRKTVECWLKWIKTMSASNRSKPFS